MNGDMPSVSLPLPTFANLSLDRNTIAKFAIPTAWVTIARHTRGTGRVMSICRSSLTD